MNEWFSAIGFGIGLVAFALGLTSIIMGLMTDKKSSNSMQKKIEYGFFGLSGIVICLLMGYALS